MHILCLWLHLICIGHTRLMSIRCLRSRHFLLAFSACGRMRPLFVRWGTKVSAPPVRAHTNTHTHFPFPHSPLAGLDREEFLDSSEVVRLAPPPSEPSSLPLAPPVAGAPYPPQPSPYGLPPPLGPSASREAIDAADRARRCVAAAPSALGLGAAAAWACMGPCLPRPPLLSCARCCAALRHMLAVRAVAGRAWGAVLGCCWAGGVCCAQAQLPGLCGAASMFVCACVNVRVRVRACAFLGEHLQWQAPLKPLCTPPPMASVEGWAGVSPKLTNDDTRQVSLEDGGDARHQGVSPFWLVNTKIMQKCARKVPTQSSPNHSNQFKMNLQ